MFCVQISVSSFSYFFCAKSRNKKCFKKIFLGSENGRKLKIQPFVLLWTFKLCSSDFRWCFDSKETKLNHFPCSLFFGGIFTTRKHQKLKLHGRLDERVVVFKVIFFRDWTVESFNERFLLSIETLKKSQRLINKLEQSKIVFECPTLD